MHPGLQRAWLQTGGQPVAPLHFIFRQAFDQVDRVEYLGSGCAKLFDARGTQVGILQFQGPQQAAVDADVETQIQAALQDEPEGRKPDPAAGDTVIRPLNMGDPADRELVRLGTAITGVVDRDDPPPIDLPDYAPTHDGMPEMSRVERPASWIWMAEVAAALVAIAAVVAVVVKHWGN